MATLTARKGTTGIKKCAFCKHYFDPTYEVISPKRGCKDIWEYQTRIAKPCEMRANRDVESQSTCPKFECKL